MRTGTDKTIQMTLFIVIATFGVILPISPGWERWAIVIPLIFIPVYFARRNFGIFGPSLFFLMAYVFRCLPFYRLGLMLMIPLIIYVLLVFIITPLKRERGWLSPGEIKGEVKGGVILSSFVVVVVSSLALILWYIIMEPELGGYSEFFPDVGIGKLLIGGILFAVVNAAQGGIHLSGDFMGGV